MAHQPVVKKEKGKTHQVHVPEVPTLDYHAASKAYVDSSVGAIETLTSKTLTFGASGPWSSTHNTTLYQNKVGSKVTLSIVGIIEEAPGTNNVASVTTAGTVDAAFRPSFTVSQPWLLSDGGAFELGYVTVTSAGAISFIQTDGGDFGGSSGGAGFSSGSISYTLTS